LYVDTILAEGSMSIRTPAIFRNLTNYM